MRLFDQSIRQSANPPIGQSEERTGCRICTRCGRCGAYPQVRIEEDGAFVLPAPVRREGLGAAVDIGTTTIVARVYDLSDGRLVHRAATCNPQRRIAADVMGRISAAQGGRLTEMRDLVRAAVRDCLGGHAVREAVVVGNTTMLHLFAGEDPSSYATAPFRAERLFGERLDVDGVSVRLPRCVHGFFGADAVAAVAAAGMCARNGCELLADIGTNGEIALWRGDRRELAVTSVAAGPAFERPGIVGSQLVAALADGLDAGTIDRTGYVADEQAAAIEQSDVRAVQLAKAAVFAGVNALLEKTDTRPDEVARFSVAGGFGTGLDLSKAARIGLFPSELLPAARACGNLAIEGAAATLLDPSFGDGADRLAATARHVELGGDAAFAQAFVAAMSFR